LNILLLSQFFSTTKGGGEYVFKTIAKTMTQNGHKVWVITNKVKDEKYEESENLKIITVNPTIQYKGGLPPTFADNIRYVINAFQKGRKIIKSQNIDVIHSNNFSPALAGSLISYFTKTPHITTIHDIFSTYDKDFWKKWKKQSNGSSTNARLVPFFEKLMMKFRFDCIHTVSDSTKNDIQKIGTKKPIHIIPNCIQDEKLINVELKRNQFVYLGRLVFYKNVEVIIKSFKTVTEQFPDAKLVIAGDGPHKSSLQELTNKLNISNNITFAGYVTPDEKKKLLAESNALLFSSIIEGFGLVMLEAFQQNRPVIVSDIPPMSEIIQNNKTGLVIDPHDENKWAEKIIQLINNPNISDEMGKEGNQILKTKYNEELFYERIIKMYNDTLTVEDITD
jgi:glycosyltransferase involved in cell wall biosynthesis